MLLMMRECGKTPGGGGRRHCSGRWKAWRRRAWAAAIAVLPLVAALAGPACRSTTVAGGAGSGVAGTLAGPADGFPLTLTDGCGRALTLDSVPRRVVSLSPATTEMLFAIGAGPQVVGVDDCSDYPAEATTRARVGAYYPPNIEKVVSLSPDLVVGMGEHQEWAAELEGLALKLLLLDPRSVRDVQAAMVLLGRATGNARSAALSSVSLGARVAAVQRRVAALSDGSRPRVFYEVYPDPLMTVGPHTLIAELIDIAGGLNIAADAATDYPVFGAEAVIQRDPEVIIFPAVHAPDGLTAEDVKARPGWGQVTAVRLGRVYAIDPDIVSRAGPRVADAAEELARLISPQAPR